MHSVPRLSKMGTLMSGAPLLLRAIINYQEHSELNVWLEDMFEQFMPDAKSILNFSDPASQVSAWAQEWGRRYFPLDERYLSWICGDEMWDDDEDKWQSPWEHIRYQGLPYQTGGFDPTEDNLHFIFDWYSWQVGIVALMIGKWKDEVWGDEGSGLRVAWMQAAETQAEIDRSVLLRIPEEGWDQRELTLALRGTKYQSIGVLAAWINNATGKDLADEYP